MSILRKIFSFHSKKVYNGEVVDLVERYTLSETTAYDGIPAVFFDIVLHGSRDVVGTLDIRLKSDDYQFYYGDIGYRVQESCRGHHYAYYACLVAFEVARDVYHKEELIITCNPDNIPSYRTLMELKGDYLGIRDVPKDHEIYRNGEHQKCIFRYTL